MSVMWILLLTLIPPIFFLSILIPIVVHFGKKERAFRDREYLEREKYGVMKTPKKDYNTEDYLDYTKDDIILQMEEDRWDNKK